MKRTVDDIATVLIGAASLKSVEIRKIEPLSQTRIVLGVCIGPAEVCMILTAGLIYAAIYVASYGYESTHACKVSRIVLRQLYKAIGVSGNVRFDGKFLGIWEAILSDLNSQEAMRRIGYAIQGDPSSLVITVVESCVNWALRRIGGTGYMPEFVQDCSGMYEEVVEVFNAFAIEASADINFDDCTIEGSFKSIDLNRLPTCNDKYDVFISYRRSDGDVYSRLLNQELSYRGFRCFLDVASVTNGEYSLQILSALRDASHFLFLKSGESLKGLDDPDDHVRIELEAARYFRKNVIIIVPTGISRDMSRISLPSELEYLRNLRAYRLDVGETYGFCIDQILRCGIRSERCA